MSPFAVSINETDEEDNAGEEDEENADDAAETPEAAKRPTTNIPNKILVSLHGIFVMGYILRRLLQCLHHIAQLKL